MDQARGVDRATPTEPFWRGFGAWLRAYRLGAGLTQDVLAERARLSVRGISDLERGIRRYPHADTVERLALAMALTRDEAEQLALAGRRPKTPSALSARGDVPLRRPPISALEDTSLPIRAVGVALLPRPLTSFIGRETEVNEVLGATKAAQLVTLVGPAGVGKTRLAIEVARELRATGFGAVYFVDLAQLDDPGQLAQAIVHSLGGRGDPGPSPVDSIGRLLGSAPALIVLDNCERLIDAVAHIVVQLLQRLPDVAFLSTSREPLGIAGELRLPLPPLAEAAGVQLFLERARLMTPHEAGVNQSRSAIAEICRRLDGLPLAIELAAARVGQLPVEDILLRLQAPFSILSRRGRVLDSRHETLHAAITWSHDLLDASERRAFACLSAFSGGFEPAAGEAIADCSFDVLGRLVDKSMVVAG
ncbi:MAG: helix-turn-helix domain-containing protein, partial [Chloroflexi bacterium]|nr:helix-turn-helix domain-containing protein [Chloroflexota bacterium]